MNTSSLSAAEVERLQLAADWFIRLKEAPAEEVLTEWMEWCEADPQNLAAFEEIREVWSLSPAAPRKQRRYILPLSLAAALTLVVIGALNFRDQPAPAAQTLSTPLAMHSDGVLEDGSQIALGGLSTVSTRFSSEQRLVVMESGEAFFRVAKDVKRPFVVHAGPLAVTALGTAFDVRRGADRIVVTVAEGKVGVVAGNQEPVPVEAGQKFTYSSSEQRMAVAPADPTLATAWQRGVFKYVREPLTDVIADLNRYEARKIIIEDETLGQERYTGTVFGNRIDDWLTALQSAFPVQVVPKDDSLVLQRRTD